MTPEDLKPKNPGPDELRVTILGCGSSPGVPRLGNDWGACDPTNPRNRRRRCALLVERFSTAGRTAVLVDTGPDLREQLLTTDLTWLDGVLYTHAHADHLHGIDDLRTFAILNRRRVDTYADAATAERIFAAFGYCYETPEGSSYPPILTHHQLTAGKMVTIEGEGGPIPVLPFEQVHGSIMSLGFRFGDLAYSSDISDLPETSFDAVSNLNTWIVDALRDTPHPSHFSADEAVEWAKRFRPSHTVLTHMHIDLDYATLQARLPDTIEPAYDGMVLKASLR
ncbi:MBL fold metallo-hydrolase [Coralliovum pocilloporae]|uniref:MBL fold metallo-hydrolase n=1 Tax=Coralliovum pocilloporae TaxID=3066369 RepID=UPI00330763EE